MTDPIKLLPCPFCGGPPMPIATRSLPPHGVFRDSELAQGLDVQAYVFCHECGCNGEQVEGYIFSPDDVNELKLRAVALWNNRNERHKDLYEKGELFGLNQYPRGSLLQPSDLKSQ